MPRVKHRRIHGDCFDLAFFQPKCIIFKRSRKQKLMNGCSKNVTTFLKVATAGLLEVGRHYQVQKNMCLASFQPASKPEFDSVNSIELSIFSGNQFCFDNSWPVIIKPHAEYLGIQQQYSVFILFYHVFVNYSLCPHFHSVRSISATL